MTSAQPDEYQDSASAGSLVNARSCWQYLHGAGLEASPHQFSFVFRAPSEQMAVGLTTFLRYADYAGWVRAIDHRALSPDSWQVTGTTMVRVWPLPSLEHLFMRLRRAGSRYDSPLVGLMLSEVS